MREIQIGNLKIGLQQRPFIIAEMSDNHGQSFERALAIVKAAADAGVQALKLQTYTPDTLTLNVKTKDFILGSVENLNQAQSLYEVFKLSYTPWEWHEPIMKRAQELGLVCFSTPCDETAVEFLEKLNVPAYKISSFEINQLPLIRRIASTGKPMIISTGMALREEISEAIEAAHVGGCKDIVLLKCTSAYPANPGDANILTIPDMRRYFGCEVGLSDHTMGIGVAIAAVAHGATVIEKHFTLSRQSGGLDSFFSIEPEEMKTLIKEAESAWQSLGKIYYGPTEAEKSSLQERRSLYIATDMKIGDIFTKENLRCIRPSHGLHPKYYDSLIGKRVKQNVKKGTPVSWELVDINKESLVI